MAFATGEKIVAALEKTGVEFIDEDGGGSGVRLKPPKAKREADFTAWRPSTWSMPLPARQSGRAFDVAQMRLAR